MSSFSRKGLHQAASSLLACLFAGTLFGQSTTNAPPAKPQTEQDLGIMATASTPAPPPKSPVQFFRELLAMSPAQRRLALKNRPPEIRKQIQAKVREYQSLPKGERELRLRATELRWYLLPLMREPAAQRSAKLALIPPDERKLVEERLEQWNLLPPNFQQELLNSEVTARYFAQLDTATAKQRDKILGRMSPARRAKLEEGIGYWRKLTPARRQQVLDGFNRFFELTPEEKEEVLNTVSDAERQEMERTLRAYSKLTPAQREQCIRSFKKFASMSVAERQVFLKNAERWIVMTPAEREKWRQLVQYAPIQPPLPPGLHPSPQPPPRAIPTGAASPNRE